MGANLQAPDHKFGVGPASPFDLESQSSCTWSSRPHHDLVLCSFATEFVSIAGETPGNPKYFA